MANLKFDKESTVYRGSQARLKAEADTPTGNPTGYEKNLGITPVCAVAYQRVFRFPIQPRRSASGQPVYRPRIPAVSRSRALTVAALCLCGRTTAGRSTRICLFLSPLVSALLLRGVAEHCSLQLPRKRQKCGQVRVVAQDRDHRRRVGNVAGRILETPGSTCNQVSHGKAGRPNREIYATVSVRDPDRQETSVLEAKYARAGHN